MIHSCTIQKHQVQGYIDSQICFHRRLFADLVKSSWYITGPVGSLGSTNQNWLDAKLLAMAALIYPVVCIHPCCLLRTQQHCLWPNGRKSLPSACPRIPTSPAPFCLLTPFISATRDITGVVKTISKTSRECYTAKLATYETQ